MNVFEHTNRLTTRVHDELIAWAAGLMQKSGLDVVDVWGRFPPEGATRSHLVVFPYRVGPDPKLIDYVPAVSLLAAPGRSEARNSEIPVEWSELGMYLSRYLEYLYPSIAPPDPRRQFTTSPTRSPPSCPRRCASGTRPRIAAMRGRAGSSRTRQGCTRGPPR